MEAIWFLIVLSTSSQLAKTMTPFPFVSAREEAIAKERSLKSEKIWNRFRKRNEKKALILAEKVNKKKEEARGPKI